MGVAHSENMRNATYAAGYQAQVPARRLGGLGGGRAGSGVIFKKWMDGRLDEWMIGVGSGVRLLGAARSPAMARIPPAAGYSVAEAAQRGKARGTTIGTNCRLRPPTADQRRHSGCSFAQHKIFNSSASACIGVHQRFNICVVQAGPRRAQRLGGNIAAAMSARRSSSGAYLCLPKE